MVKLDAVQIPAGTDMNGRGCARQHDKKGPIHEEATDWGKGNSLIWDDSAAAAHVAWPAMEQGVGEPGESNREKATTTTTTSLGCIDPHDYVAAADTAACSSPSSDTWSASVCAER